jgi:hypothetical protein
MGVPIGEPLYTYMVVMEVTTKKTSKPYSFEQTEEVKYFKQSDTEEGVLRIVGGLSPNEKVSSIFLVNEAGRTYPKTVQFVGGKLCLVDNMEETTK